MKYVSSYLTLCTNVFSKWFDNLNIRAETIKPEENIVRKFHDFMFGKDFLDMTQKV